MTRDLALVADAAVDAGRLALEIREHGVKVERKADGSPVTDADLAVDAFLKTRLTGARADYGWLSEESADDPARLGARRVFVVDPIDGTSAYIKHKPWFVVAIAVVEAGRPTAAAVYAPVAGDLYTAAEGQGAALNGAPIHASRAAGLAACRMLGNAAEFARHGGRDPWPAMQVERRNALAYRMALVGAGEFDAAVSSGWKFDWDLAAGDLIAREAGARVTDARGRPLTFNTARSRNDGLVCTAPGLHASVLARTTAMAHA